jgi:hypothetical protein
MLSAYFYAANFSLTAFNRSETRELEGKFKNSNGSGHIGQIFEPSSMTVSRPLTDQLPLVMMRSLIG